MPWSWQPWRHGDEMENGVSGGQPDKYTSQHYTVFFRRLTRHSSLGYLLLNNSLTTVLNMGFWIYFLIVIDENRVLKMANYDQFFHPTPHPQSPASSLFQSRCNSLLPHSFLGPCSASVQTQVSVLWWMLWWILYFCLCLWRFSVI